MKTVVIHTQNPADAVEFFDALGLPFVEAKHGAGPHHFAHEGPGGRLLGITVTGIAVTVH